ncbi:HAMP domain-containing sensor histidine kinase [Amycolatopsis taiwanensis]|uniref:histidine kinase n=1 Tax=Amycolatopsis taiwanensis TaxID=342230 RepID=A0A9W6VIP3_9PSEU|nr:HAMP domain-containing sensor histidine kinase [Amycolatopsis taiwanensis]GLY69905.1 two-component sensor histidine kinase [Amycolatopsis taiwanensis]
MTQPRLTVRARLTLLYTGLFAACGAVVVAVTYGLVAGLPVSVSGPDGAWAQVTDPEGVLDRCRQAAQTGELDPGLQTKCVSLAEGGFLNGALAQQQATLSHLLGYSLTTLAVVIALAAVAGWIVAGRVLRPVHQITAAARAASEHNLSARVALTGPRDELRDLADTFDDMLARLQATFDGQQRFIANASHELRTPLTVMRTALDVVLAKRDPTPADLLGMGRDIRVAVDHADRLVEALLTLARNERGLSVREEVDLATVAEDVLDATDLRGRYPHPTLRPATTSGDPVLLERLVANLVDNAVRYNASGGEIWLSTSKVDGQVRLVVANTGPVVPPDGLTGLFEPFQRLHDRTTRDGFGLGLALVASIAAVHQGRVAATPRPAGGLTVTVTLPALPGPG